MGLDFSHGDAHWSYSGFMRFRERLAKIEGFDLQTMAGFTASGEPWSGVATDLKPLLDHSDCDGELSPQECKQVAPRLKEIIGGWDLDDYDRRSGIELVAAMEYCAENGENLEFC